MTSGGKRSGGISAAELMAQLAQDRGFQEVAAEREAERADRASVWRQAERPIIDDLRQAGVDVASVWDLVNTSVPYPSALPVLMEHLERDGYPDRVVEGVARALAVKPAALYWRRLRDLYLRATGPDATEGLAVALAAVAEPEHLDDLLALLDETSRGNTRIHFIRPILRVGATRQGGRRGAANRSHLREGGHRAAVWARVVQLRCLVSRFNLRENVSGGHKAEHELADLPAPPDYEPGGKQWQAGSARNHGAFARC